MLVSAVGVGHSYGGGRPLFERISFTASAGELWSVSGPSGSGKSTLLNLIAGWMAPAQGSIRIEDCRTKTWVLQDSLGVPGRTALDHVVLPMLTQGMRRSEAEPRAIEILNEFDLAKVARRAFRHLSGGESQRLMLARAMSREPDLLLVDEPTAQLDAVNARSVIEVLERLADAGALTFVATHDMRVRNSCTMHIDLGA